MSDQKIKTMAHDSVLNSNKAADSERNHDCLKLCKSPRAPTNHNQLS